MTTVQMFTGYGKSKLPKILTKEQLLRMFKHVDSPHIAMGMFLGIFFGLRISEMSYSPRKKNHVLRWSEVDLNQGEIAVLDGKNTNRYKSGYGKDRIVPVFDEFIHVFRLWRSIHPDSEYVIPHQKGGNRPIGLRQIQDKTSEALAKADLLDVESLQRNGKPRYRYHFHTFRHVCATNLLRRGLPIEQVKEFLGHENLETTMIYLDIVKDDLKEAVTHAYAYPKQRNYFLPREQPVVHIGNNLEVLKLENENLKLKMRLNGLMPLEVVR
jgi:integrase